MSAASAQAGTVTPERPQGPAAMQDAARGTDDHAAKRKARRKTDRKPRRTTNRTARGKRPVGWRPYLCPTVRGFALILLAFGLWALAAWLDDRIPMVLALGSAILLVGSCVLTLCGWIPPIDGNGRFSRHGFLRFLSPRIVRSQARWSLLDAEGRTVAEESGPSLPGRRGWYSLRAWRCEWRDPFSLFEARRVVAKDSDLFNPATPIPPESGQGIVRQGERPGRTSSRDSLSPASVRDYSRGDPLRLISWHQSAHRGRLIVREGDEAIPSPVLVLDRSPGTDADRVTGTTAYLLHHLKVLHQSSFEASLPLLTDGPHLASDRRSQERLLATALPLPPESSPLPSALRGTLARAAQSGNQVIVVTSDPDSSLCLAARRGTMPFSQPASVIVAGHFPAKASSDTAAAPHAERRGAARRPAASAAGAASVAVIDQSGRTFALLRPKEGLPSRIVREIAVPLLASAGLIALTALPLHDLFGSGPWIPEMCTLAGLAILLSGVPRAIGVFRPSRPTRRQRRRTYFLTALAGTILLVLACLVCCLILRSLAFPGVRDTPRTAPGPGTGIGAASGTGVPNGPSDNATGRSARTPSGPGRLPSLWDMVSRGAESLLSLIPPVQTLPHEQAFLVVLSAGVSLLAFLLLLFLPAGGFALTLLPAVALAASSQITGTQTPVWQLALLTACAIALLWWTGAPSLRPLLPGILAIATCLASAFATPAVTLRTARNGLFGLSASSSFSDSGINPMVNLTRSLQLNSPTVAFTYQASGPMRFRLATLSDFSTGTWSFDQTLSAGTGLYSGSRRRGTDSTVMGYTTSARRPYPRQTALQRAIDGTRLLDRSDAQRRSGRGLWTDTQPGADARQRTAELLWRSQSGLTRSAQVRIASLQSRFLPVLGLPSRVDGIDASWQWTGDQVAFSTQSSALSSRVAYRVTGQYVPAVGAPSGLDRLDASVRLASDYRSRCVRAVQGVSEGYQRVAQAWNRYYGYYGYGSDGRGREPGSPQDAPKPPTNIQPTRAQSQALQHCVIDFADQNAFPTQQLIAGAGYGSLNSSANWMVDDDADSVYQSTAISYRGAFNSTNWKTVNGRAYREVPRDVPERIRNVVRTARRSKVPTDGRGARHEMAALRWLLRYFTESGFQYSLEAPGSSAQGNLQAISDFLRTKRGYCVHYATAFALLARMMGVATRVDLGYSSASSPVNSGADSVPEYATTQNQLHSWVEAYIDGIGWIPFDVTPGYTGAAARNRPGSVSEKDVQKARSQGNRQTGGSSSTADSDTTDSERSGSSDALNDTSRPSRDQQGSRRSETAHGPRDSTAPRTSRARTGAQDADSPSQAWSVLRLAAGILALLILLAALALAFPRPRRLLRKHRRIRLLRSLEVRMSGHRNGRSIRKDPQNRDHEHEHRRAHRRFWTLAWQEFLDAGRFAGVLPRGSRTSPTTLTIWDMVDRAIARVPSSRNFLLVLVAEAQAIAYGSPDDGHGTGQTASADAQSRKADAATTIGTSARKDDSVSGTPLTDDLLVFEKELTRP